MSKKLLILFLAIISAVCLAFGITACGEDEGEDSGSSYYAGQTSSDDDSTGNSGTSGSSGGLSDDDDSTGGSGNSGSSGTQGSEDDDSSTEGGSTSGGSSSGGSGSSSEEGSTSGDSGSSGSQSSGGSSGTEGGGSADTPSSDPEVPGGETEDGDLQYIAEVAATCTTDGHIAYWYDADNDKYYSDAEGTTEIEQEDTVLSATGHDYDFDNIEVVWNEDYTSAIATITCKNDSSHTVKANVAITSEIIQQATCLQEGKVTYTAIITYGGKNYYVSKTVTIQKTEHNLTYYKEVEATCTEEGNIEYWYCADCGKYYSDEECATEISQAETIIAAGNHSYGSWSITEPTSTSTGKAMRECSKCGDVQTITLPVLNDVDYTYEVVSVATHTEDGTATYTYNEYTDIVIAVTIPASSDAHVWDDGVVTTAATCTTTGVMTYTCTLCGEEKTEIIPVTEHTAGEAVIENYKAATCTENGSYDSVVYCAECGKELSREMKTISATGHTASSYTSYDDLYHYYNCTVCGVEIAEEHNYENGFCLICGNKVNYSVGLAYTLADDGSYYTVSGIGTCTDTEIIIPATYKNIAVVAIGSNAFRGCTSITSITIPSSITSVDTYAFYNCTALTEINFNATAMEDLSIYNYVFYGAGQEGNGITVNIGEEVTKIPAYLFYPSSSSNYAPNITSVVFKGSKCESIGNYAFDYCTSLTNINIPDSVISIGIRSFANCTSLSSLTVGSGVMSIGDSAFYDCSKITSLTIGSSVTSIGSYAFYNCTALTAINYNANSVTGLSQNSNAFANAGQSGTGITVTIGANVTSIPAYLFYSAVYTPNIIIIKFSEGSECDSIGDYAFFNCTSLIGVYYSGTASQWASISFNNYYDNPLYYAGSLYLTDTTSETGYSLAEGITIEDITSINAYVFYGCTSLTSVTIGSSVTSLGSYAFYNCTALTQINYNAKALEDLSEKNYTFANAGSSSTGITVTIGANVTKIPAYMFYPSGSSNYAPNITSVVFEGNSVCDSIGSYAFGYCTSLTSITIPTSVTIIGSYAFRYCTSLTIITIPDSVTTIGSSAFGGCSGLTSISLPFVGGSTTASTASTSTLLGYIFGTSSYSGGTSAKQYYSDSSYLTYYIPSNLTTVEIMGGEIFYGAFYGCTSLISVTMGSSITSIGDKAFYECTSLDSVDMSVNVTSIGNFAFYGCAALESVTIPDGVSSIGNSAYYGCTALKSIIIPDKLTSIGNSAFFDCISLTSVTIGSGVETIGGYAFSGCTALKSIDIPSSVTKINSYVFSNCSALTQINYNATEIDDSSVGSYVFYGAGENSGSVAVIIGTNVKNIPAGLFSNTNITSVMFEKDSQCESIGSSAFSGCDLLISITIPDGVTNIGGWAFYRCVSLESVNIPDGVTSIGSSTFSGCTALTSITIPAKVTSIGSSAFCNCTALTEINYNAISVTDLSTDNNVFFCAGQNGSGITVTIGASVTSIPAYLFSPSYSSGYEPNIVSVKFDEGSECTSIGTYAFRNCTSITSVTIPANVSSIGSSAFSGCYKLIEVYNLSSLGITAGSSGNGSVAYYAKNVYTTSGGSNLVYSGDFLFYNDGGTYYLVAYVGTETDITLPDSINGSSYSIYNYAFYKSNLIESVAISDGVTSIGNYAFYGSAVLANVTIGGNIISIGEYVFYNTGFYNDENNWIDNVLYIGNYLIKADTSISGEYTIKEGTIVIADYAFSGSTSLSGIDIPDSVITIGKSAFYNCTSLKSLTIGSGVTTIGSTAFYYCYSLTEINYNAISVADLTSSSNIFFKAGQSSDGIALAIGAYVTKIPAYMFYSSDYITSVEFAENSVCASIGTYAFYDCTSLKSLTIGSGVTTIGTYAFYGCNSITSLTIGNGVTSIGKYAFYGCTALIKIDFNAIAMEDLSSDNYVFYNVGTSGDGITVTIGAKVTNIPAYLFYPFIGSSYLPNIVSVKFDEDSECATIGSYAFYDCTTLTSLIIGNSVTDIKDNAFRGCTSLTSISIPDSVTSIGNSAFCNCTKLESLTIYSSATSIGDSAFYNCTSLTNVDLGTSVSSIGLSAFLGCTSLTSISVPDSVTSIGSWAFYDCTAITSVTIGSGVTTIGSSAFYGCTALKTIYYNAVSVADDVLSSGSNVFYKAGTSDDGIIVTIGAGVTNIPAYLFYYSSNITSVEFAEDSACTSIGTYAFYDCTSLANLSLGSGLKTIGNYAFSGCTALKSIVIPDSVTSIGEQAFRSCAAITSLSIGSGVTTIGDYAFFGCYALTEIYFNAAEMDNLDSNNHVFGYVGQSGTGITLTIGASVTKVPAYLFKVYTPSPSYDYTPNIISVSFEEDSQCKSIGSYAFYGCDSITSITIGSSVTSIGNYAFHGCTALTEINYNATSVTDLSTSNHYIFRDAGDSSKNITITIGTNVKNIPAYLFYDLSCVTSVVFKDGSECESIGAYAFYRCSSLDSIVIPDSVTKIGEYAFNYCSSLTSLTIGKGIKTIGTSAFESCTSLKAIYYNAINADNRTAEGGMIFAFAGQDNDGIVVTIGDDVTAIPDYFFIARDLKYSYSSYDYTFKITSVEFEGNSVCESIGAYAFYGCKSLVSISLINGLTSIGEYAFYNCISLTDIVIPDSVASIGDYAFYNGYLLNSLTLGSSVSSIGSYAFENCTSLISITIPASVTSIGDYAFRYCYKLIEVYNLSSLEITADSSDNGYVANYAKNVYSTSGGSKLTYSNDFVFYYDGSEYYLVGYIGTDTAITLPSSINGSNYSIYEWAFYNCTFIENITLPATGINAIGLYAFNNTGYFNNSDNWDNKVLYIGTYLIGLDTSLTSTMEIEGDYTIKDGTTYIAAYAFYNGCLITSITVPDTVTYIGAYAFYNCYQCTSINIPSNVTYIGENAFETCYSLTSILVIPSGITSIKASTFAHCSGLSIVIPNSVVSVEDNAFFSCYGLTVYYVGTSIDWSKITMGSSSSYLTDPTNATIYYYSESEPDYTDGYNYWHYVDGEITVWVQSTEEE